MPLFSAYIMVDWSGSDRRRAKRQDCIWIAHGPATATAPMTASPPSRTKAEHLIRAQLQSIIAARKGRVLLCADFGYGYPAGFASLLAKSISGAVPPWRMVWQYLSKHVQDDLERSQAGNRRTAAIASRSRAPSTPQYRVRLRPVHSGVSSRPAATPAFRRRGRRNHLSARPGLSRRFASRTGERRAIPRSGSSAPAVSAAKCLPAYRALRGSDSILNLLDAPPFGPSRPDGRLRQGRGSIRRCESCTPKSIPASEHPSPTPSRTAVRCAPCGTGRATSTQKIYLSTNSRSRRASRADQRRIT